ncbi:MAG: hypothetical protein JNM83_02235 [Myxococcales bacterium]|nr:hypothetical protein [Myxococcales bacterium]
MPRSKQWKQVDKLIEEQKLEEARTLIASIRDVAKQSGNGEEWTETLIKDVQLQIGLHGYETAVRFLREQPWPQDSLSQAALELYYAHSLMTYLSAYSWEIGKREKVESKEAVDLKAWTKEQLFLEAARSYQKLWLRRVELGSLPVKALAPYVTPNSYPPHIRGTLRDVVSYLIVEHLANTEGWTPEQSNDVFRLPFAKLLNDPAGPDQQGKLDDPSQHPLTKIARVLGDLESWHLQQGNADGQLEARLTRTERLHSSFAEKADRDATIAYLEQKLLPAHQGREWWARGQALLAQWVRASGDLARARSLAEQGHKAFPKSYGGQSCLSLLRSIEAPDFQLASMLVDGARKRSIQVTHKNLGKLYFRAYEQDLKSRIESSKDYNLLWGYQEMRAIVNKRPSAEWTVELPATPDFHSHTTFVTPPLTGPGAYVVMASYLPDFRESKNRVQAMNLIVTDLIIQSRTRGGTVDVTVVSGETGRPVEGAQVRLYRQNWQEKHKSLLEQKTDKTGYVQFPSVGSSGVFVLAELGRDRSIDPNTYYLGNEHEPSAHQAALVFTDRSIYRPSQKLLWKVVAYEGKQHQGKLKVAREATVQVRLLDPNSQQVATAQVRTNEFGTAAGEFLIPTGRLLGNWRIETTGFHGSAYLKVEEYKRPTFEVSLKDPQVALRLNRPATLVGEAKYYFGLPVTEGRIKWRIKRQTFYPWWWGYFGFGGGEDGGSSEQTVASGTSELRQDGSFEIAFTPEADERKGKFLTYSYAVSADLTDDGGETRSAKRSFRLGFVAVEAQITSEVGFVAKGSTEKLTIRRQSLDGTPRAGEGSYQLFALQSPPKTLTPAEQPRPEPPRDDKQVKPWKTPGDQQFPRWDRSRQAESILATFADGAVKAQGKLTHGADGTAVVTLPELPPGAYRLRYKTQDEFGATAEAWKELVIADAKTKLALPLLVSAERTQVKVGDKARLLISSGLPDQTLFLELFRDGKLLSRRLLPGDGASVIELPIGEEDRGGIGVQVWAVRDHQYLARSLAIAVPWDNKDLKVTFSTLRDKLRPGQKETWRVTVRGPQDNLLGTGMVELLAYMYDRSLDVFAPHSPPSIAGLYPSRSSIAYGRVNLDSQHPQWIYSNSIWDSVSVSSLSGDQLVFPDSYGIGGPGGRGGMGFGRMRMMAPGGAMLPPSVEMASPKSAGAPAPEPMAETAAASPDSGKDREESKAAPKKEAPGNGAAADQPADSGSTLRSNFSETAFFVPQLLTEKDGSAAIEFTVPDSVTSWNVWVHALTRDLSGASERREVRTVKELVVRPYLPRFFREADSADLKVMVSNAGDKPLAGKLQLEIFDPETQQSVLPLFQVRTPSQPFSVEPGKGVSLTFPLSAPRQVGVFAFKVTAQAADFADGELRPLPVLPSRMHLAQSRFVTLRDKDSRTMTFEDLKRNDDPTLINEQLVVTLDTQLFYTVLQALPYLVSYPYECVEQTLNRFLSTGIVSSVYREFPQVAKAAEEFSRRNTQLEPWDASDPNRKMTLEESPWLERSKGGRDPGLPMLNTLDPQVAQAQRDSALHRLRKVQTSSGGFPWFPGGPPSPYMTLYLMSGFARATEFKIDIPKDLVQRGWNYLAQHYRQDYVKLMKKEECCWEFLTLLNYVATAYPDSSFTGDALSMSERKEILDYTFKHWKKHSPYIKGLLALTLKRMGRPQDAKLVWDSVMDSAKTVPDQGTFWAKEDRSWLWYNDTIESHAFALRVLMELDPQNAKKDGLVLWLLLNKKLSQWKSTRATAEVIYSLVHYLRQDKSLGVREEATVSVGPMVQKFGFEPDKYVGKTQIILPGAQIEPQKHHTVKVEKATKGFMFASTTWHFSTDKLPTESQGDFFHVDRKYFLRQNNGKEWTLSPLAEGAMIQPGDEIEVQLSLRTKHAAEYVHLRDPRAAGLEPDTTVSRYKWDLGIGWYEEVRDSGTNFFFEQLPAGQYTFKYRLRANLAGHFRVGPATIQSMYAPEFTAYSAGHMIHIGAQK